MTTPREQTTLEGTDPAAGTGPAVPARASRRGVRDRDVFLLAAGVVIVVLAANLVSAAVQPLDRVLALAPVVVVLLVAVTALVLIRSVRSGGTRSDDTTADESDTR